MENLNTCVKNITIVVPVLNEEGNICELVEKIQLVFLQLQGIEYEIVFVDDGSTDQTLAIIMSLCCKNTNIFYISLSRNFGKDNAILAGIKYSNADAIITMDADLQHPPELIPQFISLWLQGYDVVYAYRNEDNQHTGFFNKIRSKIFYSAINMLSDVEMENGISDYKLINKQVASVINKLPEDKPFLRGIIKWVGFKQKAIKYEPSARYSGNTKYNLSKLTKLAGHGLTSFSTKPLTFAIYLGFVFAAVSLLYIPYIFISLHYHWSRPGWASVIFTISFFGGLQLMIMGIIGLYLGKTFIQGKNRPRYIIQSSSASKKIKAEKLIHHVLQ